MYKKLSRRDLYVAIQCMSIILDSGLFCPEEVHPRIGVDVPVLRNVRDWLRRLMEGSVSESELMSRSGLSDEDVFLAIHGSLVNARDEEPFDPEVRSRYGLAELEVEVTFDRWKALNKASG